MQFRNWLNETTDDRAKLWAKFQREFQITYQRPLGSNPQLFARYKQIFQTEEITELQFRIDNIQGKGRQDYRREQEQKIRSARMEDKQDRRALKTKKNTYLRVEDDVERVVCSDGDPQYDKTGMPAFHNDLNNPELNDYFAIHVGDAEAWLPILMRDGYCEGTHAYVYTIKTSLLARTKTPFYSVGEDYHITDKTNTPDSDIIFSKFKLIPAQYIELDNVIDLEDVEEAPDMFS